MSDRGFAMGVPAAKKAACGHKEEAHAGKGFAGPARNSGGGLNYRRFYAPALRLCWHHAATWRHIAVKSARYGFGRIVLSFRAARSANPESSHARRIRDWIPGSAFGRPGMTAELISRTQSDKEDPRSMT
jgi:hypothetical protein